MGGDFGPPVTVPAAASALKRHPSLELVMVGNEEQLTAQLREAGLDGQRAIVKNCTLQWANVFGFFFFLRSMTTPSGLAVWYYDPFR